MKCGSVSLNTKKVFKKKPVKFCRDHITTVPGRMKIV